MRDEVILAAPCFVREPVLLLRQHIHEELRGKAGTAPVAHRKARVVPVETLQHEVGLGPRHHTVRAGVEPEDMVLDGVFIALAKTAAQAARSQERKASNGAWWVTVRDRAALDGRGERSDLMK
ncbi:hypothetical protein [Streptomyces sp. NBC_00154]|uniref:hypothetical protein n=1 Tax=Streptomyces sp. NBC_00154 TaxID=2975670 RepID=UPI002253C872|nr:hypothetical protein [Streptomyces sp. NBC_00154]MCX5316954.1 hypothetical protein [Streptomyces sp. NBC_00154]